MQGLAQRVTAIRPDLISADASYGELAWVWGKGRARYGADAWAPSPYTAQSYEDVRQTAAGSG